MIFGTFDGLHKGHLNFMAQARSLSPNSFLIVSIARDSNVMRIKKHTPIHSEKERKQVIERAKLAHKVVLGSENDHIAHILKYKPDIIALGYDQKAYVKNLKKLLLERGFQPKITRLKPYYPLKYKSSLLRNKTKL